MNRYEVVLTETARLAIEQQARYIASEAGQPANAQAWLQAVSRAVEALELAPRRTHAAEEDEFVPNEVRQYVAVCRIGRYARLAGGRAIVLDEQHYDAQATR